MTDISNFIADFSKCSIDEIDYKKLIIDKFIENVKGKKYQVKNKVHCGDEGHWLETQMGISHNSKNEPDIYGYEMKKNSKKISFGDFSASEYLFSEKRIHVKHTLDKKCFIKYFGSPNKLKKNRYSWSGLCVPKYGKYNDFGQILIFDDELNLCIYYSFENDKREIKLTFPDFMKSEILIAFWTKDKLQTHINKKFNNKGFFICKKNENNVYDKICFGKPFDYLHFVNNVKNSNIIFDSGMYMGNSRNYSHFRSNSDNFWNLLIVEEF